MIPVPLSFHFRNRFWGKWKLRRYLAPTQSLALLTNEQRFYENLILKAMPKEERAEVDLVCDVGCRNWSYLPALALAFPYAAFVGIELDGGRRYWNMRRRIEAAQAFATEQIFSGRVARAFHGDFLNLDAQDLGLSSETLRSLVTFFFPFVSERPCVKWGIPKKYADFGKLLARARENDLNARIISCHQGEWEAEIAKKAYADVGITVIERIYPAAEFQELWPSPYDVHVFYAGGAL